MIFGNETISTYSRPNLCLWMILALQAGWLNMGGFLANHAFVSHVTGYATLFGREAWKGDLRFLAGLLLVPVFFLLGAAISGFMIDLRIQRRQEPRYHVVFGLLFVLLLAVTVAGFNGLFGVFGGDLERSHDYALVACLCMICGIQNGTITLVSRSVVRTTHLTGITTDLGIGLVRAFVGGKTEEKLPNLMRFGIIVFFVLGGLLATPVFNAWGFRGFLVPTAISGGLFGASLWFGRVSPAAAGDANDRRSAGR